MTDPTTPTPPEPPATPIPMSAQAGLPPRNPPAQPENVPQTQGVIAPEFPSQPVEKESVTTVRIPKRFLATAAAVIFLIAIGIAVGLGFSRESPFTTAKEECSVSSEQYAQVVDDGKTLTLHSKGTESDGLTYEQLECFWSELKMPDSVIAEIGTTRALDGRQKSDWGNIHASWTYHPDTGLQMILTLSE